MTEPKGELATLLVSERAVPVLAHLTLFALLVLLARPTTPPTILTWWGAIIVAVLLLRLALWDRVRRKSLPPATVTRIVRLTMLALGLAWGVGAAVVIRYLAPADGMLVVLGLTGLLAGGLTTLVADRWVFAIYALAMFAPAVVVVALIAPGLNELGVVLMIVFVVFTIRLHRRSHNQLRASLRVEGELRERERQLAAAQTIAHVGSWEWDIGTNVVTWSDELRRMYGVGADAGTGYAEFLERAHPDDRPRLEALVAECLATRRAQDYEWRCIRPTGEIRHILGRNVVITNASGDAVRMAGTSLDITDRKRSEENQRTLLRELQRSVAEVKVLTGILPICASCKRIKKEDGGWQAVESYVRDHTDAEFSHGLCPDCAARDWGRVPG